MCPAAIYLTGIKRSLLPPAGTAQRIGFSDKLIQDELLPDPSERLVQFIEAGHPDSKVVFSA